MVPEMATKIDVSVDEKRLLRGVLKEAVESNERARHALEEQLEQLPDMSDEEAPDPSDDKAVKKHAKAIRRAQQVPIRLAEVTATEERLSELLTNISDVNTAENLRQVRSEMETLGLGSRLETFDVEANALAQWGRPPGFEGLVVESPRGIPILIGRRSWKDEVMRRTSRGTDLWFQVRDGEGSRVLLRTSMLRQFSKAPREDVEAAADFAAYFSKQRKSPEKVEVMYTDTRQVALGIRSGQMKDSRKLGIVRALPSRVRTYAREALEEQGFRR